MHIVHVLQSGDICMHMDGVLAVTLMQPFRFGSTQGKGSETRARLEVPDCVNIKGTSLGLVLTPLYHLICVLKNKRETSPSPQSETRYACLSDVRLHIVR